MSKVCLLSIFDQIQGAYIKWDILWLQCCCPSLIEVKPAIQSQMIVLKRLQRLSLSLTDAPFFLAFSSAKAKLSDAGEQAVWAHRIIKLIKDPVVPTELGQPSILEQIEAMDVPEDCKFEFKRQENKYANKAEVMKIMTEGINLNMALYKQKNIQKAKQIFRRKPEQINVPFIFHPNYLVTSKMFQGLDKQDKYSYQLTNQPGIGGTISIMSYIHLSNFITKYVVQCNKNPQMQKQLILLQKENMIGQQFFKYWCWSVHFQDTNINMLKSSQKFILQQAVELEENEKASLLTCDNYRDFGVQLGKYYPQTIERRVIVDHVEVIATQMRKWNIYYQREGQTIEYSKSYVSEKQILDHVTKAQQMFVPAKRLHYIIDIFQQFGLFVGLISSQYLEEQLLKNKSAFYFYGRQSIAAFNLHRPVYKITLPYKTQIFQPQGKVDFWNIGWFEIWRRLKAANLDPNIVQEIKKIYMKTIEKNEVTSLFSFAHLKNHLDSYSQCFRFLSNNPSEFGPIFKEIFNRFQQYCLQEEKKRMQKVLSNSVLWQRNVLCIIHDLAQQQVLRKKIGNKKATFDIQIFKNIRHLSQVDFAASLMNSHNKYPSEILPFHIENRRKLVFTWNFQELYEITTLILFPQIGQKFFTSCSPLVIEGFKQRGGTKGVVLWQAIKKALQSCSQISYVVPNQHNRNAVQSSNIQIRSFQNFTPVNPDLSINEDVKPEDLFNRCFKRIFKRHGQWFQWHNCLGWPKYIEEGVEKQGAEDQEIDFVIGKDMSEKSLLVRTYKITALEDASQTIKRFKEVVFPRLSKYALAGGYKPEDIRFQHYVFSLKTQIYCQVYKEPTVAHSVTIFFSDVLKLAIGRSKNLEAISDHQEILQHYENLRHFRAQQKMKK